MADIIAAVDEVAANKLVHDAETALGTITKSDSSSLGPFSASWNASAYVANGTIDLIPSNIVRIADCELHYSLNLTFSLDLNSILPHFCLPQVCVWTPWGDVCTPQICVSWPTISVPVSYSDMVKFTADFGLNVHLSGGFWLVDIVIAGIPSLQFGVAAAAILAAIGTAASLAMLVVPLIGPFLAGAVLAITAAIGIAGITGFLGPILSLFVSGLTFNVYKQPKVFEVLPASLPLDPAVDITLDGVTAAVVGSDKDELVLSADISP